MLQPDWVLERYLGWTLVTSEGTALKLLSKQHGPFVRSLLLLNEAPDHRILDVARAYGVFGPFSMAIIVDFEGRAPHDWSRTLGISLRAAKTRRLFGVGTFVCDLSHGPETLWEGMSALPRRMCRKAQKAHLRVDFSRSPSGAQISTFFSLFEPIARERVLQVPRREAIQAMLDGGNLVLVLCSDAVGTPLVVNLIYVRDRCSFFLYGARAPGATSSAGHYTHWCTIRHLQKLGFCWYDLGQVPSRDIGDGIFAFKRSFGGRYIDYGSELHWSPPLPTLASSARELALRLWHGNLYHPKRDLDH